MKRLAVIGVFALILGGLPSAEVAAQTVSAATRAVAFDPPLGRSLPYEVATRRLGRDGTMISFSLIYDVRWSRVGRGYRLDSTLRSIDSDARPQLRRALVGVMEPLVGQTVAFLVADDGSRIDIIDADALWARIDARLSATGAGSATADEGSRMATMLRALPATERERMSSADIRALVGAAIPALSRPDAAWTNGPDGDVQSVMVQDAETRLADGTVLSARTEWTIDKATGLALGERRQSWARTPESVEPVLVEERVRRLSLDAK